MTDAQYEAIKAKIAELQNEDYNSPLAARLQAWLVTVVVQDYYDSLSIVDGEVVDE